MFGGFYLEGVWLVVPSEEASRHKCFKLLSVLLVGPNTLPPLRAPAFQPSLCTGPHLWPDWRSCQFALTWTQGCAWCLGGWLHWVRGVSHSCHAYGHEHCFYSILGLLAFSSFAIITTFSSILGIFYHGVFDYIHCVKIVIIFYKILKILII